MVREEFAASDGDETDPTTTMLAFPDMLSSCSLGCLEVRLVGLAGKLELLCGGFYGPKSLSESGVEVPEVQLAGEASLVTDEH